MSDGTEYDFGAGGYEPHHEQNTVVWDNAQHHVSFSQSQFNLYGFFQFGDVSNLTCRLEVSLNGNVIADQLVDLSNPLTEFQCDRTSVLSNVDSNTLSARVLVTNFEK